MPVIEFDSVEQFKDLANNYQKDRFRLLLTDEGEAIMRPSVSTKSLETLYIIGLTREQQDELEKWWGRSVFRIARFNWREDRF